MEAKTKGFAALRFLFENLPPSLFATLPDVLQEMGEQLLTVAQQKAMMFARTGELAQSLVLEVDKESLTATMGPTAKHGPFVTFGTKPHFIGAPVQVAPGVWRYIRSHPGTRGNTYLEDSLMEVAPNLPVVLAPHVVSAIINVGGQAKALQTQP